MTGSTHWHCSLALLWSLGGIRTRNHQRDGLELFQLSYQALLFCVIVESQYTGQPNH